MSERLSKNTPTRRSLILAGGGMKVAFQAGVLQVWLDEAGIVFDHADGASGGVFNLAMYTQGMSGTQIADNWRALRPLDMVRPNWASLLRGPYLRSLFRLDHLPSEIFPSWGIDWDALQQSTVDATFNVYDFTNHELTVLRPAELTPELLVACVSLPVWFPPVTTENRSWIDAVFATDANIETAIVDHGADEVWVIWTVDRSGTWHDGLLAQYFQIIEAAANAQREAIIRRIDRNNDLVDRGQGGEFGRHVTVRMIEASVPLHYLVNLSADRNRKAVELGVKQARDWCRKEGIALHSTVPDRYGDDPTTVSFRESMRGTVDFAGTPEDLPDGAGAHPSHPLRFTLDITVDNVDRFLAEPDHLARARGTIECEALGGCRPVSQGWFNLFVHDDEPAVKQMRYHLWFTDGTGHPLTLVGVKTVRNDPGFDVWSDTTTLATTIIAGHGRPAPVAADTRNAEQSATCEIVARGMLRISPAGFMHQLTTFRARGPNPGRRIGALGRFLRSFLGDLWDVYARRVLPWGPF